MKIKSKSYTIAYSFIDLYHGHHLKKNGITVVLIKKEVHKAVIE